MLILVCNVTSTITAHPRPYLIRQQATAAASSGSESVISEHLEKTDVWCLPSTTISSVLSRAFSAHHHITKHCFARRTFESDSPHPKTNPRHKSKRNKTNFYSPIYFPSPFGSIPLVWEGASTPGWIVKYFRFAEQNVKLLLRSMRVCVRELVING